MWSHTFEKLILKEPLGKPSSIRILRIGKLLYKAYSLNLTLESSAPSPRKVRIFLEEKASSILNFLLGKGSLRLLHIHLLIHPSQVTSIY